jgi:hypothetical protein
VVRLEKQTVPFPRVQPAAGTVVAPMVAEESVMSSKGIKAWMGTAVFVAAIGVLAMSASAKQANASQPPVADDDQAAAPLVQEESDPPFGSFLGACNQDSNCSDGNSCESFRKRGNHCSHACESGSDCAGTRCTKQGRCGLNQPVKTTK